MFTLQSIFGSYLKAVTLHQFYGSCGRVREHLAERIWFVQTTVDVWSQNLENYGKGNFSNNVYNPQKFQKSSFSPTMKKVDMLKNFSWL